MRRGYVTHEQLLTASTALAALAPPKPRKYEEKQLAPITKNPGDTVVCVQFDVYDYAADTGEISYETHRLSITAETFRKVAKAIIEDAQ